MHPGSTRPTILDSSSDPETDNHLVQDDHTTPPPDAAPRHRTSSKTSPLEPSDSESENPQKKKGRKPKLKLPNSAEADDGSSKTKRINWGAFPQQAMFLDKALNDILTADKSQRRVLKKKAKKEFHKKWPTLAEYTRDEVEKSINNWFKNHIQFPHLRKNQSAIVSEVRDATGDDGGPSLPTSAHSAPARSLSDPSSITLAPLLKSICRRARGPSGWWALEHRAEVSALRAELGGDIGALKTAVRKLYNPLSKAEKAKWEEKAADEKEKQSQDETQCFRNQEDFPLLVATLLDSFIGYDPQQVGSALVYFRIAMRTKSGAIQHDQYTVGLPEDADSFDLFAGGPKQDEIDRWSNYVDAVLPENPVQRDQRLTYEADGLPKLPPYDDEWTVHQARSALEAWFQAMWYYDLEHGIGLPNGLDWSNFSNTVAPHVPSSWADRVNSKPSDRPFHHVLTLYHDLFEAQDSSNAFRWTSSAPLRSTEILSTNHPAPQTPLKTMYTTYTTPTKPSIASHGSTAAPTDSTSSATPPLPRLILPTVDAIKDTADSAASLQVSSPDPRLGCEDQGIGSGAVGIVLQITPKVPSAMHASLDTDGADVVDSSFRNDSASPGANTDIAINKDAPMASQIVSEAQAAPSLGTDSSTNPAFCHTPPPSTVDGTGSVASAKDSSQGKDGGADRDGVASMQGVKDLVIDDTVLVSIADTGGSVSGISNKQLDGAHAFSGASHGLNEDLDAEVQSGKRKHQSQSSVPVSKRPRVSVVETELESVSAPSRRAVRPKPPPAGSPRKTRAAVKWEALEAHEAHKVDEVLANAQQTRSPQ